jgi:hypothetical protein
VSPPNAAPVAPLNDAGLEQALEHARFVQDLGVAGAPGAAYALALVLPELVMELRALRLASGGPAATLAISEQLWRDRALRAEERCGVLAVDARQVPRLRAAGEEILQQLADERGTREALDRRVRELDELLRRWYRSDGSAEVLSSAAEVLLRRIAAAAELDHMHGQVDALAKVLLEEFGGPTRSESACEMAVRVLREFRGYVERLRAEAGVPGDRDPSLLLWIRESRKALEAACCSGCGKVLPDRQAAAVHAAGCAQHPLGRRILELEDVVDRVSAYTNRLPVPYAGELREVLGEARR